MGQLMSWKEYKKPMSTTQNKTEVNLPDALSARILELEGLAEKEERLYARVRKLSAWLDEANEELKSFKKETDSIAELLTRDARRFRTEELKIGHVTMAKALKCSEKTVYDLETGRLRWTAKFLYSWAKLVIAKAKNERS